ncbi:MAG TPA: serine/threonine-protein kinase [Fimbriimonadaceae bacterium]|nr:serine/threonine-protein kinase [Fimbriimonadaceae bacterium]
MGETRFDRFLVGDLLGRGGSGSVYAARDGDGTEVALKILHDALGSDPEVVERFRREALFAARIRSEFIAPVVASGCAEGSKLWIAYPLLRGETLHARIGRERVLVVGTVAPIIDHVLRGLDAAHNHGVIHRDVKPSNIFLVQRSPGVDRGCLLDFGISKYRPSQEGATSMVSLTSTLATLGTVTYMPPEQFDNAANADVRADLYAVAMVAFRCLTGVLPFPGKSATVILQAKLCLPPRPLQKVTGVSWTKGADAFFERALAPEPDDRFASASEMQAAWRALLEKPGWPHPGRFVADLVAEQQELLQLEATVAEASLQETLARRAGDSPNGSWRNDRQSGSRSPPGNQRPR